MLKEVTNKLEVLKETFPVAFVTIKKDNIHIGYVGTNIYSPFEHSIDDDILKLTIYQNEEYRTGLQNGNYYIRVNADDLRDLEITTIDKHPRDVIFPKKLSK